MRRVEGSVGGNLGGPFAFSEGENSCGPLILHMGRHKGSVEKLRRSGPLDEQHEELVWNLIEQYPAPVPYDQLLHLSTGALAEGRYVGTIVYEIRKLFGFDIIETVTLRGYKASDRLIKAAAEVKADEARDKVLSKLVR